MVLGRERSGVMLCMSFVYVYASAFGYISISVCLSVLYPNLPVYVYAHTYYMVLTIQDSYY